MYLCLRLSFASCCQVIHVHSCLTSVTDRAGATAKRIRRLERRSTKEGAKKDQKTDCVQEVTNIHQVKVSEHDERE